MASTYLYRWKNKNIGRFETLEEAKQARIKKVNSIYGEFTNRCEKVVIEINISGSCANVEPEQIVIKILSSGKKDINEIIKDEDEINEDEYKINKDEDEINDTDTDDEDEIIEA